MQIQRMIYILHVILWSKRVDTSLKVSVSFDHDPSSNEVRDRLLKLYPNYRWNGAARREVYRKPA